MGKGGLRGLLLREYRQQGRQGTELPGPCNKGSQGGVQRQCQRELQRVPEPPLHPQLSRVQPRHCCPPSFWVSVSSQDQSAMSWRSGLGHIRVNSAHRAQSPTGVRCASIPSQALWTCKGRPSYFRISPGGMKPQGHVEPQAVAGKQWFQEPVSCSFKSCSVTQY